MSLVPSTFRRIAVCALSLFAMGIKALHTEEQPSGIVSAVSAKTISGLRATVRNRGPAAPTFPFGPLVFVRASDATGFERAPWTGRPNLISFVISRTGGTSNALGVSYSLNGTAIEGLDYRRVSEFSSKWVTIPTGASSIRIVVEPIQDRICERRESIVLQLHQPPVPAVIPAPPPAYFVGSDPAAAYLMDGRCPDRRE